MSIRICDYWSFITKSLKSRMQATTGFRTEHYQQTLYLGITTIIVLFCSTKAINAQTTIFSENFQSYAVGSNLIGQGGWVEGTPSGGSVLTISNASYLSTQVLNGRASTGLGQDNIAVRPFTFDSTTQTTLEYQLYATTDSPITHNATLGFEKYVSGGLPYQNPIYWSPDGFNGGGPKRWQFSVGSNTFSVLGGYDQLVTMRIVINGVTNEAYGMYDFGSGFLETPHYVVPQAELDSINGVLFHVDHRTPTAYLGAEVDNLVLTSISAVPEPSTWMLSGTTALVFGIYLWRRNRHQARLAME